MVRADMRYDDLRDILTTGDLVLFHGRGAISDGIERLTHSFWSHVGMVVRATVLGQDVVLLWESTTLSNVPDIEHGHGLKGVQLVSLSKRIESYAGAIAVRRLLGERTLRMGSGLLRAHDAYHGLPYEQRLISLMIAGIGFHADGWVPRDLSSLFCSEALCMTWAHMGLVPWSEDPTTWSPRDFSSEHGGRIDGVLAAPYRLTSEITIER